MIRQLGHLNVSRETMERLEVYENLITKWSARINLVSRKSIDDLWTRHFVDSAQLFSHAETGDNWVDMGSGGGFPGLVIAILSKETNPTRRVTLIESDTRKAAFLRTAARETDTQCRVLTSRIEDTPPQSADVLSARALSGLTDLLEYSKIHLSPSGVGLFPKGASWKNEMAIAKERWSFDLEEFTSWTEPAAAVLRIRDISRA